MTHTHTQLLVAMNVSDATPGLETLASCSAAVQSWFLRNDCNLTRTNWRPSYSAQHLSSDWLPLSERSRSQAPHRSLLSVTIDLHLWFDCHVTCVVCCLRGACSIVASRLSYCNAMLYGSPATTFNVLQWAQNNLARVVCQRGDQTNARPLFRSFNWLPVKQRVSCKMTMLMFKVLLSSTPATTCFSQLFLIGLCDLPTPRGCVLQEHELNSHGVRSQSQLHTPETHYHLTLDLVSLCARLKTPQNTPVPTVPAPLYFL